MTTNAEEVPFLSGMEREPAKLCETTVEVGKKIFALDGMITRVLEKARMAMARPDRGPDPDVEDDDIRKLASIIDRLTRPNLSNGDGGSNAWQKAMMTIITGAALAGILATVGMYGKLASIETNQTNQGMQITELKAQISELRQALRGRP